MTSRPNTPEGEKGLSPIDDAVAEKLSIGVLRSDDSNPRITRCSHDDRKTREAQPGCYGQRHQTILSKL